MQKPLAGIDPDMIGDLVLANHILYDQAIVDGFGHVSVRVSVDSFLISRSLAPALVAAADIQLMSNDGEVLGGSDARPYLERFIHGEIYRQRPDVMAVVHSHSPAVIPFGVVKSSSLKPICHMSGFLAPCCPVFEIRDASGPKTNMLITDRERGRALAGALAQNAVVLMRGHGVTVVGASLRQVVFRSVYTEVNARLQADATRLGEVTFLTDDEAANASAANDEQLDRAWNLWCGELA